MYGYRLGYNLVQLGALLNYVVIGSQTWQSRNLDDNITKKGFEIPIITNNTIWASSQTLYTNAITGGATEYEAVKAAAMCRYFFDDYENYGKTYGMLYNWFAAKLVQYDIELYNIENPTSPFNLEVPISTDFSTLADYLGGTSVAGGKLKAIGLDYWNTPNTGATNESKFNALGSGQIQESGASAYLKVFSDFWTVTESTTTTAVRASLYNANDDLSIQSRNKTRGNPIRLKKKVVTNSTVITENSENYLITESGLSYIRQE